MSDENPSNGPFLTRLPVELRLKIYSHLVQPRPAAQSSCTLRRHHDGKLTHFCGQGNRHWYPPFPPAILRTCGQIHDEAAPVFYGAHEFVIAASHSGSTSFEDRVPRRYRRYVRQIRLIRCGPPFDSKCLAISALWRTLSVECPQLEHVIIFLGVYGSGIEGLNFTTFWGLALLGKLKKVEIEVEGRGWFEVVGGGEGARRLKEVVAGITGVVRSEVVDYVKGRLEEAGKGEVEVQILDSTCPPCPLLEPTG